VTVIATAASFQPRLTASFMPLFIPCPANGGIRCAVERVGAMRKHLGDGFPLMADANMKWSVDDAIRAARALLRFDLEPKTSETHRSPT
jgi:L-alanine-DL-glutamate epimerase-like enolase superfamily enzyme